MSAHPIEPNSFEFIADDGTWCTWKHWITLDDLKKLASDSKQAERTRIRAEVTKLRDEARTKGEAIIRVDIKADWKSRETAYTRVLDLLNGEVTDGTTN